MQIYYRLFMLFAVLCCMPGLLQAQDALNVIINVDDTTDRKVMIMPMGENGKVTELTCENKTYKGTVEKSQSGFYNLISVKGYSQLIQPIYQPGDETLKLGFDFNNKKNAVAEGSNDNKALSAYATVLIECNKALWKNAALGADYSRAVIESLLTSADSICKVYGCSEPTKEYLNIWSYISAYDSFSFLPRILKLRYDELPFKRKDILPLLYKILDSQLAALFPNTPDIVYAALPERNNLDSAMTYLELHYTNADLKKIVKNNIATRYVNRYDYTDDFDKGLERLRMATEKYGLDPKFADDFAKRKATVPGQPFPENVVLKDPQGNVVDFAKFRGKYVYIDVWASWCIPCLKEVPMLQKMERELKNDKVVFLSVSVDAKEGPWKQKMKQLNMHGNQLHNPDNSLCEALNVKGIPFFVIYDAEGKLYMHGAPRPSQGRGVVELLEGLGK